jgi:LysR family transcriptional regulator, nitrogen assimilation regulatory protein
VDLKQLKALVTVAEVGSVTRAAQLLHLVQPAVTRQIRTLENELSVALFERTRQGMVLTPAGEIMVDRARRAILELERATAQIRPKPGHVTGIVAVGVLESLVDLIPQALATAVRERHPGIELRILVGYSGYLQAWLEQGDLDLALLYNLADTPSLAVAPMLDERLWAVAPPDAGLQPETPLAWEQLLAHPLVMPISGHGLRALIDHARSAISATPDITIETNSMHLQKQLVLAGYGWTVLPAAGVARDVASSLLSGAPLAAPDSTRSVVLGLPRATRTPAPVEVVATELTRLVRLLVLSQAWPSAELAEELMPRNSGRHGSPR